jgi:hypothetical protein
MRKNEKNILEKIIILRGYKVILDRDLALLYGVETKRLNEQVKRNIDRFPEYFMFLLSHDEYKILMSQNATSRWGGTRKPPYAFTEHGALMAANVINSPLAINLTTIHIIMTQREKSRGRYFHERETSIEQR